MKIEFGVTPANTTFSIIVPLTIDNTDIVEPKDHDRLHNRTSRRWSIAERPSQGGLCPVVISHRWALAWIADSCNILPHFRFPWRFFQEELS